MKTNEHLERLQTHQNQTGDKQESSGRGFLPKSTHIISVITAEIKHRHSVSKQTHTHTSVTTVISF